ncbi:MAG: DUF4397 domain-containing protein [Chitinophagaceae bacterium]|nr:DUF4397 domain-containing protein [Chitinophagaceae bacterium]
MKNKFELLFTFCTAGMLLFIPACKKDVVPGVINEMLVVNASPNAGQLELLQNLRQVGSFNYLTGTTITSPAYLSVDSGFNNFRIRQAGVEKSNFFFNNSSNKTSLWLYDSVSTLKYVLLSDKVDTPGRAYAKIRYLFLSPDMDTLNIRRNNADSIVKNAYYFSTQKIATEVAVFVAIDTGNVTLSMEPIHGTTSIRTRQFRFESNGIYSFVVKGYQQRAGADSLSLSIIKHN